MNPSANGWLNLLLNKTEQYSLLWKLPLHEFYFELRKSGFIYGSNIAALGSDIKTSELTEEEICKINLWFSFYYIYTNFNQNKSSFTESVIAFYKSNKAYKTSFLNELINSKENHSLLEKIIDRRIHIDSNIITKSFNYFTINGLLFIDVLAYNQFLKSNTEISTYTKRIESIIEMTVFMVFNLKPKKSEYDLSLMKLFEASMRYNNDIKLSYEEAIEFLNNDLEKYYLIDMVCMSAWSDQTIDITEHAFLTQLTNDLGLSKSIVDESVIEINQFYDNYKDKVAFLHSKNLVHSFYNNSSKLVVKLIRRNSKRLQKELKQSKDVLWILSQSTQRKLTDEEQKRVQIQLLDIFKTIPSLAIFILPGGMLLLPLVIKLIPKLLPSAFDDNRIQE